MCFLHVSSQLQSSDTLHPLLLSWYTCFRCFQKLSRGESCHWMWDLLGPHYSILGCVGRVYDLFQVGWSAHQAGEGESLLHKTHAFFTDTALRLSKLHCVTISTKLWAILIVFKTEMNFWERAKKNLLKVTVYGKPSTIHLHLL